MPEIVAIGFIGAVFLAFGVGASVGESQESDRWKEVTIERGLAEYCSKTGEWSWMGECEK